MRGRLAGWSAAAVAVAITTTIAAPAPATLPATLPVPVPAPAPATLPAPAPAPAPASATGAGIVAADHESGGTSTDDDPASATPAPAAGPLPTPWNPAGPPGIVRGDDLYGRIDGGAELFFEFGFEYLTVLEYRHGDIELLLEMYQFADPPAALGIYLAKCGVETAAPEVGARHTVYRYQLTMVRDRFFFVLSNPGGDEAAVPAMVALARQWAATLPPDPSRDPLGALPAEGRVDGSERMARGPVALAPIITLGDGDILSLGGTRTALAARYRGADGAEWLRLQVTYPDEAAAAAALAHLTAHLDAHLEALESTADRLVYRSFDDTFGEAALAGATLVIRAGLAARP